MNSERQKENYFFLPSPGNSCKIRTIIVSPEVFLSEPVASGCNTTNVLRQSGQIKILASVSLVKVTHTHTGVPIIYFLQHCQPVL